MNPKPMHYDGSSLYNFNTTNKTTDNQELVITDEMRRNIAGNPYVINMNE